MKGRIKMNSIEIHENMKCIVISREKACTEKINALPASSTTERKALFLERGMYRLCINAGLLHCTDTIESMLNSRKRVMSNILKSDHYPRIKEAFDKADTDEKALELVAAFQSEIFIRNQIMKKYYKDFNGSKASDDAKGEFESGIKIAVLEDVFKDFEKFRVENNIYPDLITRDLKEQTDNGK